MPESLSSEKLNQSSSNQNYLYERKLNARMRKRDSTSREVIDRQDTDLAVYAEYRELTTSFQDDGAVRFTKRFRLPEGLFADGIMPVAFVKLGYKGTALTAIGQNVHNPQSGGVAIRAKTIDSKPFEENMDYFANILVFSPTTTTVSTQTFVPVDWGEEEESLKVSSLALNQMAQNGVYINHNRVKGVIRNVDQQTNDPDYYLRYLNDNLVMYGHYEEFYFDVDDTGYNAEKIDTTDEDFPKKFTRKFEFPKNLFKKDVQPVVIYNVGAKVISDPGTEIRKLTAIIHDVKRLGFRLEIKEHSDNGQFDPAQLYFCSYIAVGEKQRWD